MEEVIRAGVLDEFPAIVPQSAVPEHDWRKLLLCGSALARSEIADEQRVALRIAGTCLKLKSTSNEERAAAAIILDTMANRRSVALAENRELIPRGLEEILPIPLRADFLKRSSQDRIQSSDEQQHPANRFQVDFWNSLVSNQWISASAPTSAGKSFLLRLWVAEVFRKNKAALVAFIVPTRALIQEFSDGFGEDVANGSLKRVTLHSLPIEDEFSADSGHLFIFTQERLHILLSRRKDLAFTLLVVDEAQKVGDGCRGILLEQVIAESMRRSAETQVVFASPFVDNPAYLIRGAPQTQRASSVEREVTTVTQNLLFASQKRGAPDIWNVSFVAGDNNIVVGSVKLPFRATSSAKRLSTVAFALRSPTGGNLIYANGAMDAEKFALHLSEGFRSQGIDSLENEPRIAELIKLVQKTIHKNYLLVQTLKHGVAFHYGNMPLLIRTEIEALFRENVLYFLVCTATLIEGINLPCKVIFLRGPTKGRGNPMEAVDFWNLAGRAGRWGTEFHGTIVCIDPNSTEVWKEPPPRKRVPQHIMAATEETLTRTDALLDYIASGYQVVDGQEYAEYDYTLTFLFHTLLRGDDLAGLPTARAVPEETRKRLQVVLKAELERLPLPSDLIFRHPGILPHALAALLAEFQAMAPEALVQLAPVLPESDDAVARYQTIFRFIDKHLRANWGNVADVQGKRLLQLAITAVDWMRGKPLAVLISKRENLNERRERPAKLSRVIIDVMNDVEEYARFKIPKYLRAFLDVLYFHTRQAGMSEVVRELPNLELWLELGVSVRTQLSLMELGMSRTGAIEVFELMMNDNMNKAETLAWLRSSGPAVLINLPELVKQEIARVLARFAPVA
jgi:hypothetical protein